MRKQPVPIGTKIFIENMTPDKTESHRDGIEDAMANIYIQMSLNLVLR